MTEFLIGLTGSFLVCLVFTSIMITLITKVANCLK